MTTHSGSPPIPATASDYFGSMAGSYDSLIQRAVPRYQEMTAQLLDYLPATAHDILELGCGTGNLSVHLARKYPDARLTLVDAAPEMTALAGARIAQAGLDNGDRIRCITCRFEDLALPAASLDLVTSCISLHHVRDKGPLYRELHRVLAPGGTFRFADQIRGGTGELHGHNWRRWLEFCRLPGHCSEAEVQSLLDHAAAHDHYTPLHEHFALLSQAGFAAVDCVWRNLIWGIVTAERGAE